MVLKLVVKIFCIFLKCGFNLGGVLVFGEFWFLGFFFVRYCLCKVYICVKFVVFKLEFCFMLFDLYYLEKKFLVIRSIMSYLESCNEGFFIENW